MPKKPAIAKGEMIGTVVVGERGQIVIPKNFRETMGIRQGSNLMVVSHGNGVLMLVPTEMMKGLLDKMSDKLSKLNEK
ncbi:MAG: AbrB/MazE/SpoVT family DNA-binding domain-containing protein [Patescibacteria group bacterium]|nr:AbrB/MazE/SpoVT family DNA-binding domain-containing protein [Patescibacteria group bacterium]